MADDDKDGFLQTALGVDVGAWRSANAAPDDAVQTAAADPADGGGTEIAQTSDANVGGAGESVAGQSDPGQDQTTTTTDASTDGTVAAKSDDDSTSADGGQTNGDDTSPNGPTGGPAAGCTEQPTYAVDAPVPVTIDADNLNDFIAKANQALGGFPHCNIDVSWTPDTDGAGKITKGNVTVKTAIIRPRLGLSRAKDADLAIMQKAVSLIQQHEEHHRDLARQTYATAPCALVGKTGGQVDAIMNGYSKTNDDAQAAYDKQFGKLVPIVTDGKITDVQLGPL